MKTMETKQTREFKFNVGDKVHYKPYSTHQGENGIIKSIPINGTGAFVVFRCDEDWENYKMYTGAFVHFANLLQGWL